MASSLKTVKLKVGGMTCANCQTRIVKQLRSKAGVHTAWASYSLGVASATYDEAVISFEEIVSAITGLGYTVNKPCSGALRSAGLLFVIAALYMLLEWFGLLNLLAPSGLAEETMGYGALIVLGLITSVHCVAMCGGLNLSQCLPKDQSGSSTFRPAFLYNLGRVGSYTAIGFLAGALGSAVSFSSAAQGVLKLVAGVFMLVMGVNMLGIFPWLRKLTPRLPKIFARAAIAENAERKSPLYIGLLNGLMPCGPLQAMQIYALSTGSPILGALSMLLFALGTVPLMFGLGAFVSALGKKYTAKVMMAGAVLVAVMGLSMLTQGFSLAGGSAQAASSAQDAQLPVISDGVQTVNSTLSRRRYPDITVSAGIPVKWVIDAPQGSINGCNGRMLIDAYGIEHTFTAGENIIEFTPEETGEFRYSCWMGMIRATITVV